MAKVDITKIVDNVVEKANKEFKDDDFKFASKQDFVSNIEWLSSGIYAVNYALTGNAFKGLPFGRTVSMVGDSNSGKSLLAQCFLKETQKMGGIAVLFDVERGIEKNQLVKMGIDVDKLVVSKAKTLEEIFEKAIFFIQAIKDQNKNIPLTIVVDSVSMASSRHEVAEGFDKQDMKRPQVIRKGLRLINSLVADEKVCFIIINHQGANIGVLYGPAKSTMGGTAVEYIPSIVIEVTKGKQILDNGDNPIGVHSTIRVKKTRLHIPFVKAELAIYFNKGFEPSSGLFGVLEKTGIVKKVSSAGWWSFYNDESKKYRETEMMEMILKDPEQYLRKLDTQVEVSATEITIEDKNEE